MYKKLKLVYCLIVLLFILTSCKGENTQEIFQELPNQNVNQNFYVNAPITEISKYVGVWYSESSVVSEKLSKRYIFSTDGTYTYGHDQSVDSDGILFMKGNWEVKDKQLILSPDELIIRGKEENQYDYIEKYEANGIIFYRLNKENELKRIVNITDLFYDRTKEIAIPSMFINGTQYWVYKGEGNILGDYYIIRNALINSQILANSDKELISKESLLLLDKFTLNLAKNELYARRGYKFSSPHLFEYFSNMIWYKPDPKVKNETTIFNETEKNNLDLILDAQGDKEKYENDILNSFGVIGSGENRSYYQTIEKDLDGDFINEKINVEYKNLHRNDSMYADIAIVTIFMKDKEYRLEINEGPIKYGIKIADFDIYDNSREFYFEGLDEENQNVVHVYAAKNNVIMKVLKLKGLIRYYDGVGKIYTNFNYTLDVNDTLNSYYSLVEGLKPVSDENIINKDLIFYKGVGIMREPNTFYLTNTGSKNYSDLPETLSDEARKSLITIIPEGTKLKVKKVLFEAIDGKYYPEPWFQVVAETGEEGWFKIKR